MKRKYTDEELIQYSKTCYTYRELLEKLGVSKKSGGVYQQLRRNINRLNLDLSHFKGRSWSKGQTIISNPKITSKFTIDEVFIDNSNVSRERVKNLILSSNLLEYKCQKCGNVGEWLDETIVLDLDHINGHRQDHRIENLRFLCPNCHSQTKTYKTKNIDNLKSVNENDIITHIKDSKNIREVLLKLGLKDGYNYGKIYKIMIKHNLKFPTVEREPPKMKIGRKHLRRFEISKEELEQLIKELPMTKIGDKFGVSNNAIKKRAKLFGLI
jgi:5-methylcytosine-specific restriction endonuclease McrA